MRRSQRAADAPADYEPTMASHVLVCKLCIPYGQKSKSVNPFAVQCTVLYTFIRSELFINFVVFPGKVPVLIPYYLV